MKLIRPDRSSEPSPKQTVALGIGVTVVTLGAFVFAVVAMLAMTVSFLNGTLNGLKSM